MSMMMFIVMPYFTLPYKIKYLYDTIIKTCSHSQMNNAKAIFKKLISFWKIHVINCFISDYS